MNSKEFKCESCNKFYASYKSLWLHKKKFHKSKTNDDVHDVHYIHVQNLNVHDKVHEIKEHCPLIKKLIKCEYCNKIFSSRSAKSDHKKKACKFNPNNPNNNNINNNNNNNELIEIKKENNQLKQNYEKMEESLKEIKLLLEKNCKIHPKTLQKINKNLINNNNNTINNNSHNTINNINKTYVNFYNSIDYKVLSKKEIMNILDKCCNSIEESIKTIHFNKKLPEYNNIFITNLKDNIAYIFDGNQFSAVLKNEAIDELMTSHLDEIESSVKEYENKLSDIKLKYINKFLDTINNEEEKYSNDNKKYYPNYKNYKSELIKNLIYSYSDPKLLEKLKTLNLNNKIDNESDGETDINNKKFIL